MSNQQTTGSEEPSLELFLGEQSYRLAETSTEATLGTTNGEGYPYTSLVEISFDGRGDFWLLLSDLAVHTANLGGDERASLLLTADSAADEQALATTRATYLGRATRVPERPPEIVDRYLQQHPQAAQLLGFSDFHWYRLRVEKIRVVAGFGKIGWVTWSD